MSKARKNTAKKVAKSSTGIVALRAMFAALQKLRAARDNASVCFGLETAAHAEYPPQPDISRDMPEHVRIIFDNSTVAQIRDLPADHPYAVWQRENREANDAKQAAHNAARKAIDEKHGFPAAYAKYVAADKRLQRAGEKIIAAKVAGLEALSIKVNAWRVAGLSTEGIDAADTMYDLLASIEATVRAAGFATVKHK